MRLLSNVPIADACRIHVDHVQQAFVGDHFAKDSLRHGRSADIPQTNKQHPHHLIHPGSSVQSGLSNPQFSLQ
jgi:hypothetical protein